jgi:hypothetical protein
MNLNSRYSGVSFSLLTSASFKTLDRPNQMQLVEKYMDVDDQNKFEEVEWLR